MNLFFKIIFNQLFLITYPFKNCYNIIWLLCVSVGLCAFACVYYSIVDACLRCQTDGKQEECVGREYLCAQLDTLYWFCVYRYVYNHSYTRFDCEHVWDSKLHVCR